MMKMLAFDLMSFNY